MLESKRGDGVSALARSPLEINTSANRIATKISEYDNGLDTLAVRCCSENDAKFLEDY